MYFCPKCNYSFDITKSTKTTELKSLDSPRELFKRLKAKKNLANYTVTFSKKDLTDHKIYATLSDEEQESLDIVFEKTIPFGGIEFKCVNCNYRKSINKTISLYQLNISSTFKINKSIEDNKLLSMNPIYPRTKDYTCKNINCITHIDSDNKEAVYYREKDSFETNYLCTKCYNSWPV